MTDGPSTLEVLADLRERMMKGVQTLEESANVHRGRRVLDGYAEAQRLRDKAEGVRLAESYVNDWVRILSPHPHQPRRGDEVEAWVRAARDQHGRGSQVWAALDAMLDEYRDRADVGRTLSGPAPMIPPPPLGGE